MAGELRSGRASADIDATTARGQRIEPAKVVEELRRAGREFGLRLEGSPDRTMGGLLVRDLFDLHLYLTESGWALPPAELRKAVDAKLAITRRRRWRTGLWRANLEEIRTAWDTTMAAWISPERLPSFEQVVRDVDRELGSLHLG